MKDKNYIYANVIATINLTIETLENLKSNINSPLYEVIQIIKKTQGNVIFSGIGKSAIIAQKASATFNSTGTKAAFLHATDALHGDVGSINKNDIIFFISKSGASKEIIELAKFAKTKNITSIALINIENDKLLNTVDYTLLFPVKKEACKNNLAPTTSTAVQMIVLDAIAVALQNLNDFGSLDFAKLHPAGSLGKKLNIKVAEVVNINFPKVKIDDNLKTVIYEISHNRIGATAVLDFKENIVGIITDGDLRRMLEKEINFTEIKALDIMTENPKRIDCNELAFNALNKMRNFKITQLLVEKQNKVIGFVHLQEILNEGIA